MIPKNRVEDHNRLINNGWAYENLSINDNPSIDDLMYSKDGVEFMALEQALEEEGKRLKRAERLGE